MRTPACSPVRTGRSHPSPDRPAPWIALVHPRAVRRLLLVLLLALPAGAHEGTDARIAHLEQEAALRPDATDVRLRLARALRRAGRLPDAEAALAGLEPSDDVATERAALLLASERPHEALAALSGLDGLAALDLRSDAAFAAGDLPLACHAARSALAQQADTPRALRVAERCSAAGLPHAEPLSAAERALGGFVPQIRAARIAADPDAALLLTEDWIDRTPHDPAPRLVRATLLPSAQRRSAITGALALAAIRHARRPTDLTAAAVRDALAALETLP